VLYPHKTLSQIQCSITETEDKMTPPRTVIQVRVRTFEIVLAGLKQLGGSEEHSNVSIMPTRMHLAIFLAFKLPLYHLLHACQSGPGILLLSLYQLVECPCVATVS
jgi:hypothetical protein